MKQQTLDFGIAECPGPPGLVFIPDFLTLEEEARLLSYVRTVRFKEFVMRGMAARRRVAHFGVQYSFQTSHLGEAPPIPAELESLRRRAAQAAGVPEGAFAQALINEYQPGAGIGWHRDAPPFGIVAGISLGSDCRMRFRHRENHDQILEVPLPAGSLYLMKGESRSEWEHMIPPAKAERYSITFRTLRKAADRPDER